MEAMTYEPPRTRGLSLGRAFGGRIVIQPSTLLMLALIALLFSTSGGAQLDRRSFTVGLLFAVLLFGSVLVHELAHAATAKAFRREVHEVVLTLWGGHTTFDARSMTPLISGVTAAVGPLANFVLAGLAALTLSTGALNVSLVQLAEGDITAQGVVRYLMIVNLVLGVFNALPGIPMDGGRVLEAIVWGVTGNRFRGVIIAAWLGRAVAVGVLVVAVAIPVGQGRGPTLFDLMWPLLIFFVLWPAASIALKGAHVLERRQGVTAQSLMVSATAVQFDATVEQARSHAHERGAQEVVVVAADGAPAGHFPVALTDVVPAESRAATGLQSVTMPIPRGAAATLNLTGDALTEALQEWWGRTDVWVVHDDDEVVGVVRLADVMNALQ